MEEQYDICILSVRRDGELAQKLADSIRSYRLPHGVSLPEGLDYRRILIRQAEDRGKNDPGLARRKNL